MKWIIRLAGVVVVLMGALIALVLFLPAEKIAKIATDQLRATTGREVSINGDVALTFWPVLGVRAEDLEVGNASWASQGPMLQANSAAIGVDVMSLLSGDIRITNIEAASPTIRLEQRLDGRASWEFVDASGEASIETSTDPARPPKKVFVEKLSVSDATLIYDAEGSDIVSYQGVNLRVDWPDRLGAAQIEAELSPAQEVVSARAEIDGFAGFITGEVQTLRADVSTSNGSIAFDGRASTSGAVAGNLNLNTENTGAFLSSLGMPAVELPPKLGRRIDLQSQITLTPDRQLAIRDLVADLSGNRLSGAADISLNGVPQINAQLNAGALDLKMTSDGEKGAANSSGDANAGWSKDTIDASGLSGFNGDIALNADSIDLGRFQLGATRTVLRNDNARMVFELLDVDAYGGQLTGEFVINNRNGLSVGGKLDAMGIEMQPVLRDAVDLDRLTGQGDAALSFLGSGNTVHAIMNSLRGDGALGIQRGTLEGIDLESLLRSGDTGGGTTIFDDLSATWVITNGELSNDDLLLTLKNYEVSGEGEVGLGAQRVDYTVVPIALRANSGQGLSIPVRFVGPWSKVSIRPDFEAALDPVIDEQKDALEAKAKEELNERLGLEQKEGQSTEDAIKDKLNDKLRSLFD